MYQLVNDTFTNTLICIKRLSDNAFIPLDPANIDYQAYLAWCELPRNYPLVYKFIENKYIMELTHPLYRTDYVGETINGYNVSSGESTSVFVKPKDNVFTAPYTNTAIILGNGITRDYPEIKLLITANAKKIAAAYKLVYACNRAIYDEMIYDYYVLKHNVFSSGADVSKLSKSYFPYDLYIENRIYSNLIPYISHMDSGASAAYLACFDGHQRVFLFGFDGDCGRGYQTVYDNTFPYNQNANTVDYDTWKDYLTEVMTAYKDVEFFRVQSDGQASPNEWKQLPNFKTVTVREAVLLGDF
jgi:hypothetical protein